MRTRFRLDLCCHFIQCTEKYKLLKLQGGVCRARVATPYNSGLSKIFGALNIRLRPDAIVNLGKAGHNVAHPRPGGGQNGR